MLPFILKINTIYYKKNQKTHSVKCALWISYYYYLFPDSNGSPTAFGACEDLENTINASNVTTYGNIFSNTGGKIANDGITCDTFAIVLANPKNNVAAKIPSGFH